MSLTKILSEKQYGELRDPTIKSIVQKLEDRTDYTLHHEEELSHIGYGASADVFSIMGVGKVLRFGETSTRGRGHREKMDAVVKKDFNYVVNYYFYKEINDGMEVSVMEELERVEEVEDAMVSHMLDLITNDYADGLYWFFKHVDYTDEEELHEAFDRMNNKELVDLILVDEYQKYLSHIDNGIRELESVGIRHQDLRRHNIMYDPREGVLKIIDLT